jgi:type II secretion system protein N
LKDRSGLRIAVYLVFFLLLTAVLVFVNFPMDRVTEGINGRLETASGGAATVESAHFSLPLSLVLSNLSVKLNGKRLNVGDARVTPHLLSLVGSSRGADVVFAGPWGKLPVSFGTDNGGWSLEGGNDEIDLSLFPGVDGLPVDIVGNLSVGGDLNFVSEGSLSGKINIRLNEAVISGQTMEMFGVKPVNLNNIQTFMSVEKNLLTLGETKIEGDIMGEGRGTIRLIPSDIGKSRLDLTLNLRPSLEAREQLAPLFSLAGARKKPDSSLTVRIRGTIDQPQFSI